MKSLETTFDLCAFIDEGYAAQTKYDKAAGNKWTPEELLRVDALRKVGGDDTSEFFKDALTARYARVIEMFGHLNEESIEARVYVPRRSWKNAEVSFLDNDELRKEFLAELFDIQLFFRAICAYAGISGEEMLEAARAKMKYNSTRPDHNTNSDAPAERNPKTELHGECPSADYAMKVYQEAGPKHSASTFHHPV